MDKYDGWMETEGRLIKISNGSDMEIKLHVQYVVSGHLFVCKELLRYKKHKTRKLGFLPIGYHSIPAIEVGNIGTTHTVLYNPQNPKKSHIKGNDGTQW